MEKKTVAEMAKEYYPRLWSIERLRSLLEAGKLTQEEFAAITADEQGEVSE